MAARKQYATHEQYIADMAPAAQPVLEKIRQIVESRIVNATRVISYGMPAFRRGKVFFYFAAFKQHIGIYPPLKNDAALIEQLKPWRGPKGNLAFPLSEKIPYALIGKVAVALAAEYAPIVARIPKAKKAALARKKAPIKASGRTRKVKS